MVKVSSTAFKFGVICPISTRRGTDMTALTTEVLVTVTTKKFCTNRMNFETGRFTKHHPFSLNKLLITKRDREAPIRDLLT